MITIQQLSKKYSTPAGDIIALQDINLQVKMGKIFGIIGKSGAGKSSLIRCVNLLERPTAGKVFVADQDLTQLNSAELRHARRNIGMIFQHFNLLSTRTVYENIALPLELQKMSKKNIARQILPLLEMTGLSTQEKYYPAQLSGGQKQRVAIARALVCKPKVLLSDEATSALDPETTITILNLLKDLRSALQLTILLITHEMRVIKHCCDEVAVLSAGKIIEKNDINNFFHQPQTAIAKNFVSSLLPSELPQDLQQYISAQATAHNYPVWRLWFMSQTATHATISQLIQRYNIHINILQGNIEYIQNSTLGVLLIAVAASPEQLAASQEFLAQQGVKVEVLGYVADSIVSFT